ncbi:uncharacterized protein [Battus philenor]|uniref:uncharacterized protein n=1 Tax=Battus philenor TaxID=42288 RepID=UPI0035CF8370
MAAVWYTVTPILLGFFLDVTAETIDLNITSGWRPEVGWEVTCSWRIPNNDSLQSVRLQKNGQQFMIYRPEIHGPSKAEIFPTAESAMGVECKLTAAKGRQGSCVLTVEPHRPQTSDFTYTCEVSGERPTFVIERKDYLVKMLVPPNDAQLEYKTYDEVNPGRVMLNCSSSGLPAPTLQWEVDENKVQADFTGRIWNATSKLWHAWSFLAYTRTDPHAIVSCSPQVLSHQELIKGTPALYSAASILYTTKTLLATIMFLILYR